MIRFLLCLPLLLFAPATAQEAPSVDVRVLCFERDASGLDELTVVSPDKTLEKIRFPESFPSRSAKMPLINGKIYFYNPSEPGGTPVATATIPPGVKKAFVMFFPAPPVEEEEIGPIYRTVVLDASKANIPEDGALLMNICAVDLRVIVGDIKILLKAGKTAAIQRPSKRNDYNMASIVFLKEEKSEWMVQAETVVHFPEDKEQFFIAFPDQTQNHVQIRAYDLSEY